MIWNVFEPDYLGSCEIVQVPPKLATSHKQPCSLHLENAPQSFRTRTSPPPYLYCELVTIHEHDSRGRASARGVKEGRGKITPYNIVQYRAPHKKPHEQERTESPTAVTITIAAITMMRTPENANLSFVFSRAPFRRTILYLVSVQDKITTTPTMIWQLAPNMATEQHAEVGHDKMDNI